MTNLLKWFDIAADFGDSIILGNGASIAITKNMRYESLYSAARDYRLITDGVQEVFDHMQTGDFELVLNAIWRAYQVNLALGVEENRTTQAYQEIRTALIQTVKNIHPLPADVRPNLMRVYDYMKSFKIVVSLNYDLIVYWALMEGNSKYGNWLKDCFASDGGRKFRKDWRTFKKPYGADRSALLFYPHGNLALATGTDGTEHKVTRLGGFDVLLDRIVSEWESGSAIPLFVSEGASIQKQNAISRNSYLSTIYGEVLPSLGDSVVIYGWSMSDSDNHIIRQVILGTDVKRIAVSVHVGGRSPEQLTPEIQRIERKIKNYNRSIIISFFDSQSPGCWIYADSE